MTKLTRVRDTGVMVKARGAGAISRLLEEKLMETRSIEDFGGGTHVADNLPAFNAAKAAINGGMMKLTMSGVYNFPTGFPDFTGFVVSPVDGVIIQCPATPYVARDTIVTDNDYRVYFNAGEPRNYFIDIRANFHQGSRGANKSMWLDANDLSDTRPFPIAANALLYKQFGLGTADDMTDITPAGFSDKTLYLTPPAGGNTQLGLTPLRVGEAITVGVNNVPDNSGELAAALVFDTGYAVLRGYPNAGNWSLSVKYRGQAATESVVPMDGGLSTYSPSQATFTIRCISPIRAQILVNGIAVVDYQLSSGTLQYAGFGATAIGSPTSINLVGWYKRKFKAATSPRSQVIGFIGDSMTDGVVHGAWPVWCAHALDGSLGIKINSIENRAISGQTLDQQIANLATNPFVNASVVAIFIGTNDIQGGNTYQNYYTSLNSLITSLAGRQVVLVTPPHWYKMSDGTNLPFSGATNSEKGGDIRAMVGRIAAERGLQHVDLPEVTGPINPGYMSNEYTDSVIRDLIHMTAYGCRFVGYEVAKAVASSLCPVVQFPTAWQTFTGYALGVSGNVMYRFHEDGSVEFKGSLSITTPANGVVMTMPASIRPTGVYNSLLWGTNDFIKAAFNPTGTVELINTNSTIVSVDGVRYPL